MPLRSRKSGRSDVDTGILIAVLALVFLFQAPGSPAQDRLEGAGPEPADNPAAATLRIDPKTIAQSETFTVTILAEHPDAGTFRVTAPPSPAGIVLVKGPVIRPFVGRTPEGGTRGETQVSYSYRAEVPGRFVLGPFRIEGGNRSWATDPVLIEVGLKSSPKTVPYEVRWRLPGGTIYEGETVALVLEMINLREIVFPDSIRIGSPSSGMLEKVGVLGDIRTSIIGESTLYAVPVAAYLFTPTKSGEIVIPPAQVNALGLTRTSAPGTLTVRPVSGEIRQTGAVGSFTVESRIDRDTITSGERVVLRVKVAGSGNLGYLQIPAPVSDSMILSEKTEVSSISPTESGYVGYREMSFVFLGGDPGRSVVTVPAFMWFDPTDSAVKTVDRHPFTVTVVSGGTKADSGTDSFPFLLVGPAEARKLRSWNASGRPVTLLLFAPGPVVLVVYALFRGKARKKKRRIIASSLLFSALLPLFALALFPEEPFAEGTAAYGTGDYLKAYEAFGKASELDPSNAGIRFNLFASAYRSGRYAEAVTALRSAVFLKPMNPGFRAALGWLDEKLELGRQVPVAPSVHPDLLLYLGAFLFNLSCLFTGFLVRNRRGMYIIFFVLSLFAACGTVGSLVYTLVRRADTVSVVGPDAGSLRKIPREASGEWFSLKPGTAVRVLSHTGEFFLIETGYGIQGWIRKEELLEE